MRALAADARGRADRRGGRRPARDGRRLRRQRRSPRAWPRAADVHREHGFAFPLGDDAPLVTGVVDVARARGGTATALVVDYKSDQVAGADLEALVEASYGGPAADLRARLPARGRARRRGRPPLPRASRRAGRRALRGGRRRRARAAICAPARPACWPASSPSPAVPHRVAVRHLPGPRRPLLAPARAHRPDRRGGARTLTARRLERAAEGAPDGCLGAEDGPSSAIALPSRRRRRRRIGAYEP